MGKLHIRMARRALAIHVRWRRHNRIMRVMAGDARERSATFEKAGAPAQVHGLVPHVPCIVKIDLDPLRRRCAVTTAAKFIHLWRAPLRFQSVGLRVARVFRRSAVAIFAAHSQLSDVGSAVFIERYRTGRVAFEATLDPKLRIGNLVNHPGCFRDIRGMYRTLSGRCAPRASPRVVAQVVFHVPVGAYTRNERDGLPSHAERPFIRQLHQIVSVIERGADAFAGAVDVEAVSSVADDCGMPRQRGVRRNGIGPIQGERVRRSGLRAELRRMAVRARVGADKPGRRASDPGAEHGEAGERNRKCPGSHAAE